MADDTKRSCSLLKRKFLHLSELEVKTNANLCYTTPGYVLHVDKSRQRFVEVNNTTTVMTETEVTHVDASCRSIFPHRLQLAQDSLV